MRQPFDSTLLDHLTQPGAALSTGVLLARPHLELLPIMRAKAFAQLIHVDPRIAADPRANRTLAVLRNRAVNAYAKARKRPVAWRNYMNEYAGTYFALGPDAADALPTPYQWDANDPRHGAMAVATSTKWQGLRSRMEEDMPVECPDDDGTETGTNRARRAEWRARRKEWLQQREWFFTITAAVVCADEVRVSGVHSEEVRRDLSTAERVCMDYHTIARLGRPLPLAMGHALGSVPLTDHNWLHGQRDPIAS